MMKSWPSEPNRNNLKNTQRGRGVAGTVSVGLGGPEGLPQGQDGGIRELPPEPHQGRWAGQCDKDDS